MGGFFLYVFNDIIYSYSTCLGRVRDLSEPSNFGVRSSFDLQDGILDALKDHINSKYGSIFIVYVSNKFL